MNVSGYLIRCNSLHRTSYFLLRLNIDRCGRCGFWW